MSIQSFNFGSVAVSFNQAGFLNATQIAKHFGKQPRDYLKTQPTREYISALAESLSIKSKILIDENQLVKIKGGSVQNGGGTWLHPKLAIHFARWLDPKFAVWCDEQIEHLLSGSQPALPQPSTVHGDYDFGMARFLIKSGAGVATVSDLHMALFQLSHIQQTFMKHLEHKAIHFPINPAEQKCVNILAHWQMAIAKMGTNLAK